MLRLDIVTGKAFRFAFTQTVALLGCFRMRGGKFQPT